MPASYLRQLAPPFPAGFANSNTPSIVSCNRAQSLTSPSASAVAKRRACARADSGQRTRQTRVVPSPNPATTHRESAENRAS